MGNNDKPLGMSGGVPAGEAVSHEPMADREVNWLVHQLEAWPTRINPDRTTNIQYLMQAAAKHIRATPINTPTPPIEGRDADVERETERIHAALHAEWLATAERDHPGDQVGWNAPAKWLIRSTILALQALGERG